MLRLDLYGELICNKDVYFSDFLKINTIPKKKYHLQFKNQEKRKKTQFLCISSVFFILLTEFVFELIFI